MKRSLSRGVTKRIVFSFSYAMLKFFVVLAESLLAFMENRLFTSYVMFCVTIKLRETTIHSFPLAVISRMNFSTGFPGCVDMKSCFFS